MSLTLTPGGVAAAAEGAVCRTLPLPEGSDLSHLLLGTLYLHNPTDRALDAVLPPTGGVTLLFPAGGAAMLCGPLSRAHRLTLPSGETVCGARLRWDCGDWLWSESLLSLTNTLTPLEPLLPGSDRLGGTLERCVSAPERCALMGRLLTLRGARQYRSTPLLRRCLALIAGRGGQLRVSELAQELGCSERYLNRLLRQKVGLSTKAVCELVQLHQAAELLVRTRPKSLLHAAVACGYFDQAHMNRHCRGLLLSSASRVRALGGSDAGDALLAMLALD